MEVNEFGANNYSGVQGSLTLFVDSTIGSTNISDISPLSSLTYVEGSLIINANDELTSLNGLQNITSIGSRLSIQNNVQLQNINALQNLVEVGNGPIEELGNGIIIQNCPNLQNIDGLLGLTEINGFLVIGDVNTDNSNLSLINLSGLANIERIKGYVILANNDSILDLTGIDNINIINGELRISGNDNLLDLKGLENLSMVDGDFSINGNLNLQNVNQLSNLNVINGSLSVDYNTALNSLSGFQNLETILSFLSISLEAGNSINQIDFDNLVTVSAVILSASEIFSFNSLSTLQTLYINGYEENLTLLSGFDNITSIETLEIRNVSEISAFNNLQNVTYMIIEQPFFIHPSISISGFGSLSSVTNSLWIEGTFNQDINFLENLTLAGDITIIDNSNLSNFCGLINVFENNGLTGAFFAGNNLFNPSQIDMENGNCSI